MNPELPSVSTIRVDKPGKSKFAPSIGGRKSASTPASTAQTPAKSTARTVEEASPTYSNEDPEIVLENEEIYDPKESIYEESETHASKPQGTRIQSVATRRQTPSTITTSSSPQVKLPDAPKNAAMLGAEAGESSTAHKRTMAYFLKDSGQGREMPTAGSASGSAGSLSPGRRVVNLKKIKAPRSNATTALAPQVRVVDGAIVFDEQAAAVAAPAITDDLDQQLEYVDEADGQGRHLTSATYAKRSGSNRWNAAETDFFYEALSMCGTDFSLIQTLFPHRTRAQVKGKFKIEERASPERVAQALRSRKPYDSSLKERIQATIPSTNKK